MFSFLDPNLTLKILVLYGQDSSFTLGEQITMRLPVNITADLVLQHSPGRSNFSAGKPKCLCT